jgi:hypothetical protein
MPPMSVPSVVTSSTEPNPFIQVPTPIQRPFGSQQQQQPGRQSFYLSHAQQQQQSSAYDEGDGIVPSTPTLFVPRRGDGFADPLNSPRVPQGRFVFSSSIPEAQTLSALANETTLGVDDTRMDLSQFDDNSGRSVPNTPLANSPAVPDNNSQTIDIDSEEPAFEMDPTVTETILPTELESESSVDDSNRSATNAEDIDVIIESDVRQGVESTQESSQSDESSKRETETSEGIESESTPTSSTTMAATATAQRGVPTARRGRGFGGPLRAGLQRRPILPPTPSPTTQTPPTDILQSVAPTPSQPQSSLPPQQPPPPQQQQPGRTIRLGTSKFSTRGNFRGRPTRGGPGGRGGRGGYHYNN